MKSKRVAIWPLYRKIKEQVVDAGLTFYPRKIFETDDELEAYAHERARIDELGLETLFNAMPGGVPTKAEIGAAISKALKAYVQRCRDKYGTGHPPEVAAKIAAGNRGKKMPREWVEKMKLLHASGKMDHVYKIMSVAGNKALSERGFSADHRRHLSEARIGKPHVCAPRAVPLNSKQLRSKSRYKGVQFKGRYYARVCIGGKLVVVGHSADEYQAAVLYDNATEDAYGVRLNGTHRNELKPTDVVVLSTVPVAVLI
jgi:hypothetical protein